jgi:hypothetical protein
VTHLLVVVGHSSPYHSVTTTVNYLFESH